jgi:hypothetical protein
MCGRADFAMAMDTREQGDAVIVVARTDPGALRAGV